MAVSKFAWLFSYKDEYLLKFFKLACIGKLILLLDALGVLDVLVVKQLELELGNISLLVEDEMGLTNGEGGCIVGDGEGVIGEKFCRESNVFEKL